MQKESSEKIRKELPKSPSSTSSVSSSSFDGLSEQAKNQLLKSLERRCEYERIIEENRHREEKGRQLLALVALLSTCATVCVVLTYSVITKNINLTSIAISAGVASFFCGTLILISDTRTRADTKSRVVSTDPFPVETQPELKEIKAQINTLDSYIELNLSKTRELRNETRTVLSSLEEVVADL